MIASLTRRDVLTGTGAIAVTGAATTLSAPRPAAAEDARPPAEPFLYGLNTGTLHGQKLPLPNEAGFG